MWNGAARGEVRKVERGGMRSVAGWNAGYVEW